MAKNLDKYELEINLATLRKTLFFPLLGIIAFTHSSCLSTLQTDTQTTFATTELSGSATPASLSPVANASTEPLLPTTAPYEDLELTPSELQEFDSVMLELDPDQQLVTDISQQQLSTTVNITTGPGFSTLSQERQNEIATGMQAGLSQICLCSPYLKFNTEKDQPLVEIGQHGQWQ